MRLPSASSLDRVFACPASHVLPPARTAISGAAERGTAIHSYIETARQVGREAALGAIPDGDLRAEVASIDLDSIPTGAESEVALGFLLGALSPDGVARAVRYSLDGAREYPDDGMFHATLDLVGLVEGSPWIADIKTGAPTASAYDSWQLRLAAVAVAVLAKADSATVAFWFERGGRWMRDEAHFDAMDLALFEQELAGLAATLGRLTPAEPGPLTLGPHCRYCPHLMRCEAQRTWISGLTPTLEEVVAKTGEMTPGALGEGWLVIQRVEDAAERLRDAYRAIVEQRGPIPLPDGRTLDLVSSGDATKFTADAPGHLFGVFGREALVRCATISRKNLTAEEVAELESAGHMTSVSRSKALRVVGKMRPKFLGAKPS